MFYWEDTEAFQSNRLVSSYELAQEFLPVNSLSCHRNAATDGTTNNELYLNSSIKPDDVGQNVETLSVYMDMRVVIDLKTNKSHLNVCYQLNGRKTNTV